MAATRAGALWSQETAGYGERRGAAPPRLISPCDAGISGKLREATAAAFVGLTARQASVLSMRYGLGCALPRSIAEISRELALPVGRVLELEANALRRLRRPLQGGFVLKIKR